MLVQEKVLGGKLVCIEAEASEGRITKIRITGDFFLHPEETIDRIEGKLLGKSSGDDIAGIVSLVLAENKAQLIGATPEDLGRLIRRAIA